MYGINDQNGRSKCEGARYGSLTSDSTPQSCEVVSTVPAIGSHSADQSQVEMLVQRFRSPWIRAAQLPELFCSWDLAYRCTRGDWLRPIVQGKRRTIYRLADVLICMRRIEAGELPLPRRNKAAQ